MVIMCKVASKGNHYNEILKMISIIQVLSIIVVTKLGWGSGGGGGAEAGYRI